MITMIDNGEAALLDQETRDLWALVEVVAAVEEAVVLATWRE